jgi:hypothetical protein
MRLSGWIVGPLVVALAATLIGCSATDPTVALVAAKQSTIALEKSMSEYVPLDDIISTRVTTKSAILFRCLGHANESYWPGTLTAQVKSGVDQNGVLGAIAAHWEGQKGWTVTREDPADSGEIVELRSNTHELFTVQFSGPQLQIAAVSACFPSAGLSGRSSY